MTTKGEKPGAGEGSGGSIGFLRASEKMWISTFEVPLVFLEDLGFSKERIQAAKDFNRNFIGGFYARVYKVGDKLSFGRQPSRKVPAEKSAAKKSEPVKATGAGNEAASAKAKPATAAATAKKKAPATKAAPSSLTN